MKTYILATAMVLGGAVMAGSGVMDTPEWKFKSSRARGAVVKYKNELSETQKWYRQKLAQLQKERDAKLATSQDTFVKVLQKVMTQTTKSGDLDEAIKLRDAIRSIKKTEVKQETPVRIPDGAVTSLGHHYLIVTGKFTRVQAAAACKKLGGYLVRIESAEEYRLVGNLIRSENAVREGTVHWIDGSDIQSRNEWKFSNGQSAKFLQRFMLKGRLAKNRHWVMANYLGNYLPTATAAKMLGGYVCEWEPKK